MNNPRSIPNIMELPGYEESIPAPDKEAVTCSTCGADITYGARFHCQCGAVTCACCVENPAGSYMYGGNIPDVIMCPACNMRYAEQRILEMSAAMEEALAELAKAQERFERAAMRRAA